jgi:C1A family cysteine protease
VLLGQQLLYPSIILVSLANGKKISHLELGSYSFAQYVIDFGKVYEASESREREIIFNRNLASIVAHNRDLASWTESVNIFTDNTDAELEARKGIDKALLFKTRMNKTMMKPKTMTAPLPETVDWRGKGILTPVKDQGYCGRYEGANPYNYCHCIGLKSQA